MLQKLQLYSKVKPSLRAILWREYIQGFFKQRPYVGEYSDAEAAQAAFGWLQNAFHATGNKGVAALYSLTSGYAAAYPETTGYIIPTLYDYAVAMHDAAAAKMASECAQWLTEVQYADGSIQAGYVGMQLPGCVFNTGMVLAGLTRAYKETKDPHFLRSAERAAHWLCESADQDGCWRRNLSQFVDPSPFNTYNVLVSWALAQFAELSQEGRALACAKQNMRWTLTQANDVGFFAGCEMAGFSQPITHTIAYTLQGVLETSLITQQFAAQELVMKTLRQLAARQRQTGGFAGIYDATWHDGVTWDCLTGTAQFVVLMARAWQLSSDMIYQKAYNNGLGWLKRNQVTAADSVELHGGLFGSFPIYGGYHPYSVPNWAVKYLIDALLLRIRRIV